MAEEIHPILKAVDHLQELYTKWIDDPDPRFQKTFPQELIDQMESTCEYVAQQDVPVECRGVAAAVAAFDFQFQAFLNGEHSPQGEPRQSFDRALKAVFDSRVQSEKLRPKLPESVAELRRQGVSDYQIAHHIYGYNGEGPFIEKGAIRKDLIDKEAAEQYSVTGRDWIPGYEIARLNQEHKAQRHTLRPTAPAEDAPAETVEGLLRAGQYVDVIARLCKVKESQVVDVAKALDLEATFRPNLANERAPQEPQITKEQAAAVDAAARPTPPQKKQISRSTRERVIELSEAGKGAQEIADEIGGDLTPKTVAAILRKSQASEPTP